MSYQTQPTLGDLTASGTLSGLSDSVILECNGISGGKAVISGTWIGTVKFQQTLDDIRWDNVGTFSGTTGAILSGTGTTINDLIVFVGIAGVGKIRAIFTSYTSGTATVLFRASNGVSNIFADNLVPGNFKNTSYTNDGTGLAITSTLIGTKQALDVSTLQGEKVSTLNSSTTNLLSSTSFTGTSESIVGYQSIAINFKSDQNITIQVQQSTDGTNWDISDNYTVLANVSDSRSFKANSSFFRIIVTNNGGSTTTFFRLQTLLSPIGEPLPRALTQNQELKVCDTNNSGGLNGDITVGTSAVEGKVGSSRLVNRKYVIIEPLDTNIYMGFNSSVTTSNGIPLFKNQFIMIPIGDGTQLWFIADSASKHVRFGELA